MDNLVTISTYRIEPYRSSKYQIIKKIREINLPKGEHKIIIDNRNNLINYMNYNKNNTKVSLKCDNLTEQLYNSSYKHPSGVKIMSKKLFTSINIEKI